MKEPYLDMRGISIVQATFIILVLFPQHIFGKTILTIPELKSSRTHTF